MSWYISILLYLSAQLITINGECGYSLCRKTDPKKLNIHLIPHSHDDVGWVVPADYEYNLFVRTIINSVVHSLLVSPERKFTYVEMYFFHRWWTEQNTTMKTTVRKLIESGQLVFTNGGWTVNDEGAAHYNNIIDQMTLGLRFLNDTFGQCGHPKVSWQIDPFGASREMPSLYALMGFDAHYFSRGPLPHGEYVWKGSDDLQTKIFTSILHDHYTPLVGFDFDNPSDRLNDTNAVEKTDLFISIAKTYNKDYGNTNQVLMPMGTDFRYEVAENWYSSMDRLIATTKARHPDVNMFYSTPNCYIYAINSLNRTFNEREVDYLTYWTGYYTSRPALKYQDRVTNNILQASKQLDLLAQLDPKKTKPFLNEARNQVAVLTHHDAITGTSPQKTADDYSERLQSGYSAAKRVVQKAFRYLKNKGKSSESEVFCDSLNITECSFTETNDKIAVTLYNPIGRSVSQYIRVPVVAGEYQVLSPSGVKLSSSSLFSVSDSIKRLPERKSKATHELVFKVDLPALGFSTYFVERLKSFSEESEIFSDNTHSGSRPKRAVTEMKGKSFSLKFDETTGALTSITTNGKTHKLKQSFKYYKSMGGKQGFEDSGSYNFCPDGSAQDFTEQKMISMRSSNGLQELDQQFSDYVKQTVRTYADEDYIEFDWTVGPIPIDDGIGKEIITRFETDLKTDNIFYTDANGRQTIKRRFDTNRKNCINSSVISGNWYPVYSRIAVRDEKQGLQLTVLNDRTQGGSSLMDGEMELMVHRRLTHNGRGGGFKIDELGVDGKGLIVRGKHYLFLKLITESPPLVRNTAEVLYMSPVVIFDTYSTIKDYSAEKVTNFSGLLSQPLPENVHLLTLENWKPNQVLIRLEDMYESNDNLSLSKPVDVNLGNMFKTFHILDAVETTLAANELLSESKRLHWNSNPTLRMKRAVTDMKVSLSPQQIRTFILTVSVNIHDEGSCSTKWVNASQHNIPTDAYIAGRDSKGQNNTICRTNFNSKLVVGKASPQIGCVIIDDGQVLNLTNESFEVLVAKNVEWVPRHGTDPLPEEALIAAKNINKYQFIGRKGINNSYIIGNIDDFFIYELDGNVVKEYHNHEVLVCV